jgi:hypothetical protein
MSWMIARAITSDTFSMYRPVGRFTRRDRDIGIASTNPNPLYIVPMPPLGTASMADERAG